MSYQSSDKIQYMDGDTVSWAFQSRGWKKGKYSGGGDLYFNGVGTSDHPHLHLKIGNAKMVRADRREIRLAVTMLAWSDGQQGHGGGGWSYIRDAEVRDPNWERNGPQVNSAVIDEFLWIMDYFTSG